MLVDGRSLPAGHEVTTDLCVIGAGPAGLSIALEFAGSDIDVCLVESGGLERDPDIDRINRGEDAHCRVHGLANLFVAGASVFPTAGFANPTLTVVALAIRLADRLKALLRTN